MSKKLVGQILNEKYRIEKWIGGGEYGDVYLATEMLNLTTPVRSIALKIIKTEKLSFNQQQLDEQFNDCIYPARIIDLVGDYQLKKHFVQIYNWGSIQVEGNTKKFIAMEFVRNAQSFSDIIQINKRSRYYPRAESVENMMRQLFTALSAAHHNQVVHRDLHPGNVLFGNDGVLKIVDFGLSLLIGGHLGKTGVGGGMLKYAAPETYNSLFDYPSDIYSAGLMIYEYWTNYHPFDAAVKGFEDEETIGQKYKSAIQGWRYEKAKTISSHVSHSEKLEFILQKCLETGYGKRYLSADSVLADLDAVPKWKMELLEGRKSFEEGNAKEAIPHFLEALAAHSNDDEQRMEILELLGFCHKSIQRYEEAREYLTEVVSLEKKKLVINKLQNMKRSRGKYEIFMALAEASSNLGDTILANNYRETAELYR